MILCDDEISAIFSAMACSCIEQDTWWYAGQHPSGWVIFSKENVRDGNRLGLTRDGWLFRFEKGKLRAVYGDRHRVQRQWGSL